jgi:hypothetical protein
MSALTRFYVEFSDFCHSRRETTLHVKEGL